MENKLCKHFKTCGGCSFQDTEYPKQLKIKEERLLQYFRHFSVYERVKEFRSIIPSPFQWYYRNKMEFSFQGQDQSLVLGLHKKDRPREVLDLEECLIFSKNTPRINRKILEFFRGKNFSAHSTFSHKGYLRHLVVRESKFTDEILLNVVTTSSCEFPREEFVSFVKEELGGLNITSLLLTVNDSLSDAVIHEKEILLEGQYFILEKFDGVSFKIYPQSFFQTNPYGVREIYERIKEEMKTRGLKKILDLYCGSGGISLYVADICDFVHGVEVNPEAVKNATDNAQVNSIGNVKFYAADARKFLYEKKEEYKEIDAVIVNPPRSGLSKKVIKRITEVNPQYIFYVSCGPKTLAENLFWMQDAPFDIEYVQPVDLFPHTQHLETLVLLKRR